MLGTRWTVGLLLLLFTISSQAATNRPDVGDGKPTEVQVFGAILDVDKIDSAEQNFTLNFYVMFRWNDHRLAHDQEGSVIRKSSEIWNPRLTITNTQRFWANTKDEVEISAEGVVTYRLHVFGDFSQPLDLHNFPHDSHVFEVPIVAAGYREGEVEFIPMPGTESFISTKLSVADWDISEMLGVPRFITMANGLKLPGFVFSFEAKRLIHHYIVKAIIPLALIVMMSWVVFWIDPKQVSNQLSVAVTTVLTLIAYHIALSGRLPQIPYLTQMDKFLFSSTILVFMSLIEVVITSHLSSTNRLALARRIDLAARWFFPVLFALSFAVSFVF